MCDNTAVGWSEYSRHVSNVETEVRQKLSRELLQHIRFLEEDGSPECYIQGVERARVLVLNNTSIRSSEDGVETQEKLF